MNHVLHYDRGARTRAAAMQAANGLAELTRFACEGAFDRDRLFHPDAEPIEQMADALKMAIEVDTPDGATIEDEARATLHRALVTFLEGWA